MTSHITDLLGAMPAALIGPVAVLLALLGVLAAVAWKLGRGGAVGRPAPEDGASAITQIRARAGNDGLVIVSRQRPALFDYLEQRFRTDDRVQILLDRRWGQRRYRTQIVGSERRRGDSRRPVAEDNDLTTRPFIIISREDEFWWGSMWGVPEPRARRAGTHGEDRD